MFCYCFLYLGWPKAWRALVFGRACLEDVWARSRRTMSYCWQVGWPPSWGRSWTYSFLAWAMSLQWALRHCWFLPSHLLHWCR